MNTATTLPTILLTGFEPFGGVAGNPSWDAVQPLDGSVIGGHRVVAQRLPVTFDGAMAQLPRQIARQRPALVLSVGLAGGRSGISLERVAINLDDARIPDNDGAQPRDQPIANHGPAAYFTTLPVKAIRAALLQAGFDCSISHTAGTYVCNHVFYGALHALRRRPGSRAGFIHIPWSPREGVAHPGQPTMEIATVTNALRLALQVAIETDGDIAATGGSEH